MFVERSWNLAADTASELHLLWKHFFPQLCGIGHVNMKMTMVALLHKVKVRVLAIALVE